MIRVMSSARISPSWTPLIQPNQRNVVKSIFLVRKWGPQCWNDSHPNLINVLVDFDVVNTIENVDDNDDDDDGDNDCDDYDDDDDDGDAGRVDDSWVWRPLPRKTLTLTSYSWLSHLLPHHRCCPFSRRFRSWNSSNHFSFSVHLWSKWQSRAEKKNIETGSCKCVPGGKIGETDFSICLSYW